MVGFCFMLSIFGSSRLLSVYGLQLDSSRRRASCVVSGRVWQGVSTRKTSGHSIFVVNGSKRHDIASQYKLLFT